MDAGKYCRSTARNSALTLLGYWFAALLYWEALLHFAVYGSFSMKFAYIAGFSVIHALVITVPVSFFPGKGNAVVNLLLSLVMAVLYGSQMVYNFIFGTMYSVAQMEQGGAAMTSFWRETLSTMMEKAPWLLALLVPAVVLVLLRKFCGAARWGYRVLALVLAAAAFVGMEQSLYLGGTEMFSDYDYYHSTAIATNQTAQRFGLLTTFRLELLGSGKNTEEAGYYIPEQTLPQAEEAEEAPALVEYNVMDIDMAELNTLTEEKKIQAINDYCAQLTGTNKNEYTGMLKDYNLIVLCAESFDTGAIHPEVTPTLYKLANEGILFQNYYNSFPNTTTDGEYALMQGLWPDSTRSKAVSSLYASRGSYLPFTLGNVFREQAGIESWGYHNYRGSYYGRNESHPNMGYTMQFMQDGMEFTTTWPSSDFEMMEQSVEDYIGQEQFHAYYMTFSGHYKYETGSNFIAKRNWETVKDLPYSAKPIKAYLSCHVELDKALAYLMQRLEDAGVADKTAIVLAGDHFPYGLSDKEYSELIGYEIDDFSKYKSSLIFWVGGLEETIVVDEYCCNVDILPTILNLWGFEYDSRMLAGTDVFSDGPHTAVLIDKSWMNDKVWFNANTGEVRYLVEESTLPENYVDNMNLRIATQFAISADILNEAYYNFVFDKGEVAVNRRGWHKS
nr:LTA synthase family protein [Oscillospiraceae bacterium]